MIVAFQPSDLWRIDMVPRYAGMLDHPDLYRAAQLSIGSWAFSYRTPDWRILASAGVAPGGLMWAFMGRDLRRDMVAITRFGRRMVSDYRKQVGPLHAQVDPDYGNAVRWVKALGFRLGADGLWTYS